MSRSIEVDARDVVFGAASVAREANGIVRARHDVPDARSTLARA
jgi:hypothetical protein